MKVFVIDFDIKNSWGPGPWMNEPDLLIWIRNSRKAMIRRSYTGALCGYTEIDSFLVNNNFEVHGGITYESNTSPLDEDTGLHWIGFDCSHCMDLIPGHKLPFTTLHSVYRDFEYVVNETNSLSDQISNLSLTTN